MQSTNYMRHYYHVAGILNILQMSCAYFLRFYLFRFVCTPYTRMIIDIFFYKPTAVFLFVFFAVWFVYLFFNLYRNYCCCTHWSAYFLCTFCLFDVLFSLVPSGKKRRPNYRQRRLVCEKKRFCWKPRSRVGEKPSDRWWDGHRLWCNVDECLVRGFWRSILCTTGFCLLWFFFLNGSTSFFCCCFVCLVLQFFFVLFRVTAVVLVFLFCFV